MHNSPRLLFAVVLLATLGPACGNKVQAVRSATPTVRIDASPTSGIAPLTVQFRSTVSGGDGTVTYSWDFGDESTADVTAEPEHVFEAAGSYTVVLTVTDEDGDSASDLLTIAVGEDLGPTVALRATPTRGLAPLDVDLRARGAGGNPPLTFSWDLGDGTMIDGLDEIAHTYAADGTYTVTVTVTDADGDTGTDTEDIVVSVDEQPTVAVTATPDSGQVTLAVTFDCAVTGGNQPFRYAWDFGDGASSTMAAPTHTYTLAGTYTATCMVTDMNGDTASEQVVVTVLPDTQPMVILSGNPASGLAALTVDFRATVVGGEAPIVLDWDYGEGTTAADGGTTTSHVYTTPGSYLAVVTATDADGDSAVASFAVAVGADEMPVVALTANPRAGVAPLQVSFQAAAAGGNPPLRYDWDFGDGAASELAGPAAMSWTYAAVGTYSVAVTVTDADGDTAVASLDVVVDADTVPAVTASAVPTSGQAPLQAALTCAAVGGNPPLTYRWDLGDGATANRAAATHTYAAAGTYDATCVVTDVNGDVGVDSVTIDVTADTSPSVVLAASPGSGRVPLTTTLTTTVTGGDTPFTYDWSFGDGQTLAGGAASESHTYSGVGVYRAMVTVTDADGDVGVGTFDIAVGNEVPTVVLTAMPPSGVSPLTVDLDARAGGGDAPLTFDWDFGDGQTATGAADQQHVYTVSADTTFTVTVTVTDDNGDVATDTALVTVRADTPAAATATAAPQTGIAPLTVAFTCTGSGDAPLTYEWDFGDGRESMLRRPSHTYLAAGTYSATCTVTDSDGDVATSTGVTVTVDADSLPVVSAAATPNRGFAPLTVDFAGTVTGGNSPFAWLWDFGDGNTATAQDPTHTYAAFGVYPARVTVTDADGDVSSTTVTVTVIEDTTPSIVATATPTSGRAPLAVNFSSSVGGGNPPLTVTWDFGDGNTGTGGSVSHTYATGGTFTAVATVTDSDGDTDTATVTVTTDRPNTAPVASSSILTNACAVPWNGLVELDGSGSTDADGDQLFYQWSFVSLPPGSNASFNNATVVNPTFMPDVDGAYTIRLVVSDGIAFSTAAPLTVIADSNPTTQTDLYTGPLDGPAGTVLGGLLQVRIDNGCGAPLPGAWVQWSASNAAVPQEFTTTDQSGITATAVGLGIVAGPASVTAASGAGLTTWDLTVRPGPARMLLMSPGPAVAVPGPVLLSMQVVDEYLNPVDSGPEVSFELCRVSGSADLDAPGSGTSCGTYATSAYASTVAAYDFSASTSYFQLTSNDAGLDMPVLEQVIFEDFESPLGWGLFGPQNTWEIGAPTSGPGAAYSGTNVLATRLDGDFSLGFSWWDIEAASLFWSGPNPFGPFAVIAEFWHWYDIPEAGFGGCTSTAGYVQLNGMDGQPDVGYPGINPCEPGWQAGYSGSSTAWTKARVFFDGGGYGNFEFQFRSDQGAGSIPGPGWYIDDLTLSAAYFAAGVTFLPGPPERTAVYEVSRGVGDALCATPAVVEARVEDAFGNRIPGAGEPIELTIDGTATYSGLIEGSWVTGPGATVTVQTAPSGMVRLEASDTTPGTVNLTADLIDYPDTPSGSIASFDPAPATEAGYCRDGYDNDCDGDTDCNDSDCAVDPGCVGERCSNPLDIGALVGSSSFSDNFCNRSGDENNLCVGTPPQDFFLTTQASADGDYDICAWTSPPGMPFYWNAGATGTCPDGAVSCLPMDGGCFDVGTLPAGLPIFLAVWTDDPFACVDYGFDFNLYCNNDGGCDPFEDASRCADCGPACDPSGSACPGVNPCCTSCQPTSFGDVCCFDDGFNYLGPGLDDTVCCNGDPGLDGICG